ncbi:MAG: hypothetical protein NZ556_04890 [Fimbriimonadales bacterium]|nr:hypothetical protein [Fimbriimonadales bacterium]
MQAEAYQVILRALQRLNLIGELQDDDYRLDRAKLNRLFERASVRKILCEASALLEQGAPVEQATEQIAQEWGAFLMDAVMLAAGDLSYWDDSDESDKQVSTERVPKRRGKERVIRDEYMLYRIPLDWLPEPQRREAERYLQYMQSKLRKTADSYLNAFARTIDGNIDNGREYILQILHSSACVEYDSDTKRFLFAGGECNECAACRVLQAIDTLVCSFQDQRVLYWTHEEIKRFILLDIPLPANVGVVVVTTSVSVIDPNVIDTDGWAFKFDWNLAQIRLYLIPIVSPEGISEIYRRLVPYSPRALALHHHAPQHNRDCRRRIASDIGRMLAEWNRHAPPEWRYTSQHAEKVFRKALRNACRAIDGAGE